MRKFGLAAALAGLMGSNMKKVIAEENEMNRLLRSVKKDATYYRGGTSKNKPRHYYSPGEYFENTKKWVGSGEKIKIMSPDLHYRTVKHKTKNGIVDQRIYLKGYQPPGMKSLMKRVRRTGRKVTVEGENIKVTK